MVRIARVLELFRRKRGSSAVTDVRVDAGANHATTPEYVPPAGIDSLPLPGDYVVEIGVAGTRSVTLGAVDPAMAQTAQPGGVRLYSRNSEGEQVAEVHLTPSGAVIVNTESVVCEISPDSVTLENSGGSIALSSDGTIDLNGVKIDSQGAVSVPVSLKINGVEHALHTHLQPNDANGDSQSPTGPPVPAGA